MRARSRTQATRHNGHTQIEEEAMILYPELLRKWRGQPTFLSTALHVSEGHGRNHTFKRGTPVTVKRLVKVFTDEHSPVAHGDWFPVVTLPEISRDVAVSSGFLTGAKQVIQDLAQQVGSFEGCRIAAAIKAFFEISDPHLCTLLTRVEHGEGHEDADLKEALQRAANHVPELNIQRFLEGFYPEGPWPGEGL
jgi:hypothetical protein